MASTTHVLAGEIVERIRPCHDQVLIEKIVETRSAGGILLPTAGNKNDLPTERGKIIAVGPGKYDTGVFIPTKLKPGQEVIFHSYPSGCQVKEGGKEYTIIADRQVVAVLA